jgi:hypothetical protein
MDKCLLVKLFGSSGAPILILSSYPTKSERSTVHMNYSTVNDTSDICVFDLYAKLGLHKVGV